MPNEKSSSLSSSNFFFWASVRRLYVRFFVSVPLSGGCANATSSPWSLIIGGLFVVRCRSDAPRSIISRRNASMLGMAREKAGSVPPASLRNRASEATRALRDRHGETTLEQIRTGTRSGRGVEGQGGRRRREGSPA